MSDRRRLHFASEDDAIAEVNRLRAGGYAQAGRWSLPQVCNHLDKAMRYRMIPGPFSANTPEQDARQGTLREVLASGRLPEGILAPEPMLPPAECGDESIGAFVATLTTFRDFPGPFAPHRVFGNLGNDHARKLNLIHCAHHLSYLTPMPSKS